ncbi:hypothetical protein ACTFIY_001331 [Dictyostelium cf. discoideum]
MLSTVRFVKLFNDYLASLSLEIGSLTGDDKENIVLGFFSSEMMKKYAPSSYWTMFIFLFTDYDSVKRFFKVKEKGYAPKKAPAIEPENIKKRLPVGKSDAPHNNKLSLNKTSNTTKYNSPTKIKGGITNSNKNLLEKLFEEAGCDLIKESSLVGGTSTGIIAISKAVGKTGNDELSNLYAGTAAKNIFFDSYLKIIKNIIENGEAYDSEQLEDYARKVLVGPSRVIENNQNFFVTACSPKNGNKDDVALDILSNYKPVDNDSKSFIVDSQRFIVGSGDDKNQISAIEAIRATSDIPGAFKLITKNDVTFYDGGFLYNNPILVAYGEARNQFPNDKIIILSFGTAGITNTDGITNDQLKDINIQSNIITT